MNELLTIQNDVCDVWATSAIKERTFVTSFCAASFPNSWWVSQVKCLLSFTRDTVLYRNNVSPL